MYYVMRASAPSLHRESTDSLICNLLLILNITSIKSFHEMKGDVGMAS